MKHYRLSFLLLIMIILFLQQFGYSQISNPTTEWSLWMGSHYTGLQDYTLKVAEFDRGVEGFVPELRLDWFRYSKTGNLRFKGYYYDPKRMNFSFAGQYTPWVKASARYQSFYRQNQRDLLANLSAREATDRTGAQPGGKMLTSEQLNPEMGVGFRRQEIQTNLEIRLPGMENIKIFASHRSIFEKGQEEHIQIMHCATCHLTSRVVDLERNTHAVTGGVEADLGKIQLSYKASYRTFSSNVEPFEAFFDTAQHPVNGTLVEEFSSRNIFSGESVPMNQYPETQKLSHTLKAKGKLGKGSFLAQFVNFSAENTVDLIDPNITVSGNLKLKGNYGNLRLNYPLFKKSNFVLRGYYGRFENDPINIDVPPWREGRPAGDLDIFDWTRYSNFTRTELKGSGEFIYQPSRKYRLNLLAGIETRERDDYPFEGAKDKTTTLQIKGGIKYRPTEKFTGRLSLLYKNIDNPFAPYKHMFERPGYAGADSLVPENGAPAIYYYQRDALRYGDITSLPAQETGVQLKLSFMPQKTVNFTVGLNASMAANSDEPELDFKKTSLQPLLGLNLIPSDKFAFYSSYSYLLQTQNGIAAVAMMDG
ncbi:MAG: hypothetical protein D6748_05800 [Calditrichaeota bacterium]|nr:MAG: hypothetical protein D6748_05800 [Calditrichota bacterium]